MACKKTAPDSSATTDSSPPTLSYPFASLASADKFTPFGAQIASGLSKSYIVHLSDTTQACVAACSGIVSSIVNNPQGGNDITFKFNSNSIYSFIYSGVRNPQVQVSDSISPGSVIGFVSGSGNLQFTLVRSNSEALCPQNYASQAFNNSIQLAITKNNYFNPSGSVNAPCLVDSLPE
jgi:hypothetical protein